MLTANRNLVTLVERQQEMPVKESKSEVPYGTLDLMILKTLETMGAIHGYGIARRIEQVAEGSLALNQGTIYPALLRLEQRGWISSDWGTSENNRRARYYLITKSGKRQLLAEQANWQKTVATLSRLLENAR
jgi:PadR family transcriptional regulator, regulatory protein PadR